MSHTSTVTRPFHDWEALHGKLKFIYDLNIPKGQACGVYQRSGEYSAWLVRHGHAYVEAYGEKAKANPGEWLFCFADTLHQEFDSRTRLLSLRVENQWSQGVPFIQGPPLITLQASDYPELEKLAQAMRRESKLRSWTADIPAFVFSWKTHVSYSAYLRHQRHLLEWKEALTTILLRHGYRLNVPKAVDSRLAHALNTIELMSFAEPFSGPLLAKKSKLTLRQLNLLCFKTYGMTIQAYWENRRMDHSKHMLEQKGMSVKMAASALGFNQLSHFSAWFKQKTGLPPRAYLKKHVPSDHQKS